MANYNNNSFPIDFVNICGMKSNLNSLFPHLQIPSQDILALRETQILNDLDVNQYDYNCFIFLWYDDFYTGSQFY